MSMSPASAPIAHRKEYSQEDRVYGKSLRQIGLAYLIGGLQKTKSVLLAGIIGCRIAYRRPCHSTSL
jgi:hypothetical protein